MVVVVVVMVEPVHSSPLVEVVMVMDSPPLVEMYNESEVSEGFHRRSYLSHSRSHFGVRESVVESDSVSSTLLIILQKKEMIRRFAYRCKAVESLVVVKNSWL